MEIKFSYVFHNINLKIYLSRAFSVIFCYKKIKTIINGVMKITGIKITLLKLSAMIGFGNAYLRNDSKVFENLVRLFQFSG